MSAELVPSRPASGTLVRLEHDPDRAAVMVRPGERLIQGPNGNRVRAELRRQVMAGLVERAEPLVQCRGGGAWVVVRVLREERPMLRAAGWLSVLAVNAVGLALLLWEARWWILAGALVLGVWCGVVQLRGPGHRPICTGLHCPGCSG